MRKFAMSILLGAALVALPAAADDKDATFGTVKEFRAGDEITINVPNAPDKSFDLKSTDEQVMVASGLKVGDPVKVVEREHNGKKMIHITKHSGEAVSGSGRMRPMTDAYGGAAAVGPGDSDKGATFGTVKEFRTGDEITINVPNWPDKSYDLKSTDEPVMVASGLKVGDRVKVVERDHDGKKMVHITKDSGERAGSARSERATPMTDAYADADKDATFGTVKEFQTGDEITINVPNLPDKSFDLKSTDEQVVVASGLKVGDPVKVVERERDGKKTVHITKHSGNAENPRTDQPVAPIK